MGKNIENMLANKKTSIQVRIPGKYRKFVKKNNMN